MPYTEFAKGSEWRKWDLHIHTPLSIYQRFGSNDDTTWEKYIDDIENLPDTFAVLGINDYLFIDGYKKLKLEQDKNGRLKKLKLLPVVEFRIEKFAGIDFGQLKRINLHVIFSDELSLETIQSQFLNTLEQSYFLEDGNPWTRAITLESVEELGKQIKATIPAKELHKYGSDLTEGFNNLNVKEDKIFESLKKDCFKGKYLIAVGKTEWGDLKWTDASIATKKSIINCADIVFTAAKSVEEFQKAKKQLTNQGVNDNLLDCSDAHYFSSEINKDKIGNCFTWIKADPTFEGLKQIIYEPDLRVAIQANLPEDKAGYQVIDRVEINNTQIFNSLIELNPCLNSIIGGRSTGKSVLLAAIAKKLKTDKPVKFDHNPTYDEFVNNISGSLRIIWKDGEEENNREIEYFQQGYMYELARQEDKLSILIQDILRQKGKESILSAYNKATSENKKRISDLINDLFQIIRDVTDKEQKARDKGDKKGVEDEIKRLTDELKKLNTTEIEDKDKDIYNDIKEKIEQLEQSKITINTDILNIENLKQFKVFKETISYELTSISDSRKVAIDSLFETLKSEFELKWVTELEAIQSIAKKEDTKIDVEIKQSIENKVFIKVSKSFNESTQLMEFEGKIKIQKEKLFEINNLLKEIDKLKKQKDELKENIKQAHNLYKAKINEIIPQLSDEVDDLKIIAVEKTNLQNYKDILSSGLDQRSSENQIYLTGVNSILKTITIESEIFEIFEKLIEEQLSLKGGYTNQVLATRLLSENFYKLSYDLEYEGDDFIKMSDGKKAFVVLKLLLDFSNKNCPILIDQPEDDLDNRAIYNDLVKYLRKKKKLRQIIVATHNPNIVVGADSEIVLVANQNGLKNFNRDLKQFQYVTGSLEHTFKDIKIIEVLESKGIREHICEILEGGDIAFKKREEQYGF
jgi:predicted ATPase